MTEEFCHEKVCISQLVHLHIEGKIITKEKEIMYEIKVVKNNGNIYSIKRSQQSFQHLRKAIKSYAQEKSLKDVLVFQKKLKKLLTRSNFQLKRLEECFNQLLGVDVIRTSPIINHFIMPEDWFCIECHENKKTKTEDNNVKFNQSVVSKPFQYPKFKVIKNDGLPQSLKQPTPSTDDVVQVFKKDFSGWWCVLYKEKLICFPCSYLKPETSNDDHDDDPVTLETPEVYTATKSYNARNDDEVSFNEGDRVKVLEKKYNGWWFVEVENKSGLAPAVFLEHTMTSTCNDSSAAHLNHGFTNEVVETRL